MSTGGGVGGTSATAIVVGATVVIGVVVRPVGVRVVVAATVRVATARGVVAVSLTVVSRRLRHVESAF